VAVTRSLYRWGVSPLILGIDTRPSVEQQSGDCSVPILRGPQQGRPSTAIPRVDGHALVQQGPHALDAVLLGCVDQLLPERRDARPAPVHLRQSSSSLSPHPRTPAGPQLQSGLASSAPQRSAAKAATAEARAAARSRLADLYGPTRALLVAPPPEHLDGSLPADLGFDPLGLGTGRLAAMRTYELLHARWAMLGAVGAIVPEALTRAGVELGGESVWWRVGAAKLAGETINWGGVEGFHIAGAQGVAVIAACQLVLMGGPEYARQVGIDSLEPVGNYAVKPTFSDGHESGLFTWEYLYFLGSEQDALWSQYHERLSAAGVDRDAPMGSAAGAHCGHTH
jgi:hypothetical protein